MNDSNPDETPPANSAPAEPSAAAVPTPPADGRFSTTHQPKRIAHRLTEHRKNLYIEGLRKSGSHRYAAMYATANGEPAADPRQFGYAYSTFARERRIDSEFREACLAAENESLGRVEEARTSRSFDSRARRAVFICNPLPP